MRASERRYYDLLARDYEDWALARGRYAGSERPGWRKELDRLIKVIEELDARRVLDVACGTGIFTRHLHGRVVGLDQSEAMLEEAQLRCRAANFTLGNALALPFPDDSFDLVFTAHFYGHLRPAERTRFLREASRVAASLVVIDSALRPGVASEGMRKRVLGDGSTHRIYKRFFRPGDLAGELEGSVLFSGDWFVMAGRGPARRLASGGRRIRGRRDDAQGTQRILAVDGGESKTDVALISASGDLLSVVRGAGVPYASIGLTAAMRRLGDTVATCCEDGSIGRRRAAAVARLGIYCLPGVDLSRNKRALGQALARRGWTAQNILRNDTFAALRAGTDRSWGAVVICGAGINCLGVHPGGRTIRYPALGWASGDVGGGYWVGQQAVAAAVRGRDGRGPRTLLERLVPEHFGLSRPSAVGAAIHSRRLHPHRVVELPPLVFAAAEEGDDVASSILERLADEVTATAIAVLRRLRLVRSDAEVILSGGLFRSRSVWFVDRIRDGVEAVAPRAQLVLLRAPPVLGAALLGLDALEAPPGAARRVRAVLTEEGIRGIGVDAPL